MYDLLLGKNMDSWKKTTPTATAISSSSWVTSLVDLISQFEIVLNEMQRNTEVTAEVTRHCLLQYQEFHERQMATSLHWEQFITTSYKWQV